MMSVATRNVHDADMPSLIYPGTPLAFGSVAWCKTTDRNLKRFSRDDFSAKALWLSAEVTRQRCVSALELRFVDAIELVASAPKCNYFIMNINNLS